MTFAIVSLIVLTFLAIVWRIWLWYEKLPVNEAVRKVADRIAKGEYTKTSKWGDYIISDRVKVFYSFSEHGQSVNLKVDDESIPLNLKEQNILYNAYSQNKELKNYELRIKLERLKSEFDV